MVPRRILLERLLDRLSGRSHPLPARAVAVVAQPRWRAASTCRTAALSTGDILIGADGLHSVVRDVLGAPPAKPTGWCSWQGLGHPSRHRRAARRTDDDRRARKPRPVAGRRHRSAVVVRLALGTGFLRPQRPIEMIRSHFAGWSDLADEVLATLTDDDLAPSPFPHFRHPVPDAGAGAVTLLGDAAHTMPPTLAQGTNQALLDTMVLRKALSDSSDIDAALRRYEKHPPSQSQSSVVGDHEAGVAQRGRTATRVAHLGPRHDLGADPIPRLDQSPRHRG